MHRKLFTFDLHQYKINGTKYLHKQNLKNYN